MFNYRFKVRFLIVNASMEAGINLAAVALPIIVASKLIPLIESSSVLESPTKSSFLSPTSTEFVVIESM